MSATYTPMDAPATLIGEHKDEPPSRLLTGFQVFGAIGYLTLCPVLGFFPNLIWFFPGAEDWLKNETKIACFRALMALVFTFAFTYIFAIFRRTSVLIRMTVAWRMYYVSLYIFYCCFTVTMTPLMLLLLVASVDLGLPPLMCILPEGESFSQTSRTFFQAFLPPKGNTRLRDWYAWGVGMFGFVIVLIVVFDHIFMFGFFTEKDVEDTSRLLTFALGCLALPCFVMLWASHRQHTDCHMFAASQAVILEVVAAFWYWAGVPEHIVVNLAVWVGLFGGIYWYTLAWQFFVSPHGPIPDDTSDKALLVEGDQPITKPARGRLTPTMWLVGSAGVLAIISTTWYAATSFYSESAATLAHNIHEQDLLVAALAMGVGIAALDLKPFGMEWSYLISWYLPMAAVYFTSETKMLAHMQVGTPFHPSWHARHLAPVWADQEIVNVTFWIATFLLTAFGTSFTCWFLMKHTQCTEGWSWLTFHGALIVLASGWFMALFISGLPPPWQALSSASIEPLIPTASKVGAVATHKKDLIIGIFFIMAGPMANKMMPAKTGKFVWGVVAAGWLLFVVGKVRLILGMDQFDPPPL